VAQAPLPLQEFLPAQACFSSAFFTLTLFFWEPSVAQPLVPLQEFLPAHACFSCGWAVSLWAPAGLGLRRRVQTPHGATEQARKGRCENQGIVSTHDVTFSLCLKRSHLNRDLIAGGAQQTRQERAARLSPSMNGSREFPIELWPHHIGAGETRLIVFNLAETVCC
jgi:hypothetical protein